jgi:hypothetical protein
LIILPSSEFLAGISAAWTSTVVTPGPNVIKLFTVGI